MSKNHQIEQRAVIRYLMRKNQSGPEIFKELTNVYGDDALPFSTVKRWMAHFRAGRESFEDAKSPGAPTTVTTEENVEKIKNLVMADRRLKVREIAAEVGISLDRVHLILHEKLGLSKVCARWVPRLLTDAQKQDRAEMSLALFHRFTADPADFKRRIVTGDETWVYHYDPETKQQSMQWTEVGTRPPVKAKVVKSAGKVMLTLFWDSRGWIHVDWLPPKETITGEYYANVLSSLRASIVSKRRGKWSKGVLLLHDNAPVHKCHVGQQALQDCKFEQLDHPPYSPDLAPSDFHVFRKMKMDLKGQRFSTDQQVKDAVMTWLDTQTLEFWENGIDRCKDRWLKCFNADGDYVEK